MAKRSVLALVLIGTTGSLSSSERDEFMALIKAAGLECLTIERVRIRRPDARYLIGRGNLTRLKELIVVLKIRLLVVNIDLAANQHRNLEKMLAVKIWDRTALILDIFSQRARTYQGKLQVELAQLEYESTRLVRGWTHLERQRGAIGQRGGPGEKQLEVDRRLLRTRMEQLKKKLHRIKRQRQLSCGARQKARLPTISLVGYTNAGKSTLFNAMTRADALASVKLFATLDPTIRRVRWDMGDFLLADTVGFIEGLSRTLLESFAATLGEIKQSDLVVHILDISDGDIERKRQAVCDTLAYIGVESMNCLTVYNKSDVRNIAERMECDWQGNPQSLWLSAVQPRSLILFSQAINARLKLTLNGARGAYLADSGVSGF